MLGLASNGGKLAIRTLITLAELGDYRAELKRQNRTLAFVPTMGALHDGHLSLVKKAKELGDVVLVSIFVNPKQFGPGEDFAKYPRTLTEDFNLLESVSADAVFMPNAADVYPDGFQTYIVNKIMGNDLCGASRPGHFEGVLTIVLKLFNWVQPDVAVFGKKDYQQWRLIETMVRDFYLPIKIIGAEIIREADGLAMSSRNRYMDAQEREVASNLSKGLRAANDLFKQGEKNVPTLLAKFKEVVQPMGEIQLEYVEIRHQKDLTRPSDALTEPAVMLVAARVGTTRLIDNLELA